MGKRYLYILAGVIWAIPGVTITIKGFKAYIGQPHSDLWWQILITLVVMIGFFLIFRKVVNSYSARIASLPEKGAPWHTFPPRGWILLIFMAGMGITLNHIPSVPPPFTASFYSGLGPMLLFSAIKFIREYFR